MAMVTIRCSREGCPAAASCLEDPSRPGSGAPDGLASMELVDNEGWHMVDGKWLCAAEPHLSPVSVMMKSPRTARLAELPGECYIFTVFVGDHDTDGGVPTLVWLSRPPVVTGDTALLCLATGNVE